MIEKQEAINALREYQVTLHHKLHCGGYGDGDALGDAISAVREMIDKLKTLKEG